MESDPNYYSFRVSRRMPYSVYFHWVCDCGARSTRGYDYLATLVVDYEKHLRMIHHLDREDEPF